MTNTVTLTVQNEIVKRTAATVCEPCKRRKKSCDKLMSGCGRCGRLLVKCWYESTSGSTGGRTSGDGVVLPPLVSVVPGFLSTTKTDPLLAYTTRNISPSASSTAQIHRQTTQLLHSITRKHNRNIRSLFTVYFNTFNQSLPLLQEEILYKQLQNGEADANTGLSALLLGIILMTTLIPEPEIVNGCNGNDVNVDLEKSSTNVYESHKNSRRVKEAEELYKTIKSIYSLLHGAGTEYGLEMVQLGCLIASWEFCQAKNAEAWGSVGAAIRMAQVLGLHSCVSNAGRSKEMKEERMVWEARTNVWWSCVVLERLINHEWKNGALPYSSPAPQAIDYLPLVPLNDGINYRVKDEVLLPSEVNLSAPTPEDRGFTRFGAFAATIQMTHLSDLTMKFMHDETLRDEERETEYAKFDVAFLNYASACIPPPGKAYGRYCGAYGIRSSTAYTLHLHTLSHALATNNTALAQRCTLAIQSQTRIIIYATYYAFSGVPFDFDGIAFWANRIACMAALMHIRFGVRDEMWESDLEVLKRWLRYYEGRFGIYAKYMREIEEVEMDAVAP